MDRTAAAALLFQTGYLTITGREDHDWGLHTLFEGFYASIPHQWHTRNELARFEGYHASMFYSCLDVEVADSTNRGRVDMAVRTPQRTWLFEFKIAETAEPGEGLQQMHDRGYADKYRTENTDTLLVAIDFSRETRNIANFETTTA